MTTAGIPRKPLNLNPTLICFKLFSSGVGTPFPDIEEYIK